MKMDKKDLMKKLDIDEKADTAAESKQEKKATGNRGHSTKKIEYDAGRLMALVNGGWNTQQLADEFKVSKATIGRWVKEQGLTLPGNTKALKNKTAGKAEGSEADTVGQGVKDSGAQEVPPAAEAVKEAAAKDQPMAPTDAEKFVEDNTLQFVKIPLLQIFEDETDDDTRSMARQTLEILNRIWEIL